MADYQKLTPISAAGTTEPRYLGDRFADVVNVMDFGAKGDGATDDSAAFAAALAYSKASSSGRVFVPSGTYYIEVDGYTPFNMNSLYGGGMLKLSTGHVVGVASILDSPSLAQCVQGELAWTTSGIAPQDMSFCDGYVFITTHVSGNSFDADTVTRVTQFNLNLDPDYSWDIASNAGAEAHVASVELTGLGHGEGCQAVKIDGQIYLFSEVSESAQNANGGDGYTKIEWHGNSTTSSHVSVVRGVRDMLHAQVSVSPDGSLVLFGRNNVSEEDYHSVNFAQGVFNQRVTIYSRKELEDAYSDNGEAGVAEVMPLHEIYIPKNRRISGRSGVATDGRVVYVLTTGDTVTDEQKLLIYSFDGVLLKDIDIDAFVSANQDYYFYGYTDSSNKKWYPIRKEVEGIAVYKESIYLGARVDYTTKASAVTFCGRTYITGGQPYSSGTIVPITNNLVWVPTKDTISASTYNPSYTGYAAPSEYKHHTYIVSISPRGTFEREYPMDITSWSPFEVELISRNRINIASHNGDEIVFGTYYPTIGQFMRVQTLNRYGQLRIFNVDDAINDISSRNNFAYLKANGADCDFEIHADSYAATNSGTTIYMHGTDSGNSVGFRFVCGGGSRFTINKSGNVVTFGPFIPNVDDDIALGLPAYRWSSVYAGSGSINTSDARCKAGIVDLNAELLEAWGRVGFKVFQFADSVERKGAEAARLHVGVVAQEIRAAFEEEGLDASRYGLFCHDEWGDIYEDETVVDEEAVLDDRGAEVVPAKTHIEKRLAKPAGDMYGVRYEEALSLECAYLRLRLERMEEKYNEIAGRLAALEEGDGAS